MDSMLKEIFEIYNENGKPETTIVLEKLAEVRLRGRKREMIG
jgi:tRNA A-37 threonylcarbamoyl transferase component Bud32